MRKLESKTLSSIRFSAAASKLTAALALISGSKTTKLLESRVLQ